MGMKLVAATVPLPGPQPGIVSFASDGCAGPHPPFVEAICGQGVLAGLRRQDRCISIQIFFIHH
jgi:hypothetical protein